MGSAAADLGARTRRGLQERLKKEHAKAREDQLNVNQGLTWKTCEESEDSKEVRNRAA